jgi:hypothetical protein
MLVYRQRSGMMLRGGCIGVMGEGMCDALSSVTLPAAVWLSQHQQNVTSTSTRAMCMPQNVRVPPSGATSHDTRVDILSWRLPCCCRSDLLLAVVLVGADVVLSVGCVIIKICSQAEPALLNAACRRLFCTHAAVHKQYRPRTSAASACHGLLYCHMCTVLAHPIIGVYVTYVLHSDCTCGVLLLLLLQWPRCVGAVCAQDHVHTVCVLL